MDVLVKQHGRIENVCYVPTNLFAKFDLAENRPVAIKVGHLNEKVMVKQTNEKSNAFYMPRLLLKRLLLLDGIRLNVWKAEETIYFGPVVGVFVNNSFLSDIAKGSVPADAAKAMQANTRAKCFVYYFANGNIHWDEKMIKGCIRLPGSGKWISHWLPLPAVVYDCSVKLDPRTTAIRQRFSRHPDVRFINENDETGKPQLYESLSSYPEMRRYLPESVPGTSAETGKDMLTRQKGIAPITYKGRKLELRVLLCKNGRGEWDVIYNRAHVAKDGAAGTSVMKYKHIYAYRKKKGKPEHLPAERDIKANAVTIASYIEKALGALGVLGIVMTVDRDGRTCFIDAETTPEKLRAARPDDAERISRVYLHVFQYAEYLAKKASGAV